MRQRRFGQSVEKVTVDLFSQCRMIRSRQYGTRSRQRFIRLQTHANYRDAGSRKHEKQAADQGNRLVQAGRNKRAGPKRFGQPALLQHQRRVNPDKVRCQRNKLPSGLDRPPGSVAGQSRHHLKAQCIPCRRDQTGGVHRALGIVPAVGARQDAIIHGLHPKLNGVHREIPDGGQAAFRDRVRSGGEADAHGVAAGDMGRGGRQQVMPLLIG